MKTEIVVIGMTRKDGVTELGCGDKFVHIESGEAYILTALPGGSCMLVSLKDGSYFGCAYVSVTELPLERFYPAKSCKITVEV